MFLINTSEDYADEFDYPIISIFSSALRNYLVLKGFHFLKENDFEELYFGSNEELNLSLVKVKQMIQDAREVPPEQTMVIEELNKVPAIDIIGRIINILYERLEEEDQEELKNFEEILERYEQ